MATVRFQYGTRAAGDTWDRRGRAPNWTTDEEVVLVYFISRGANFRSCAALINAKCGSQRTYASADYHMRRFRKIQAKKDSADLCKLYDKSARWDMDRVNKWVTDRTRSVQHALDLIDLGAREREIISEVVGLY